MGLYFYLKANLFSNKEVICPAYTCIVMAHAVELSGNKCVFVDAQVDTLNMDPDLIYQAISPQTAAVILTSLFGKTIDLEWIIEFKKKFPEIKIIHDSTHFFNEKYSEQISENCDAVVWGLGLSKPVTSLFGGVLTHSDFKLIESMTPLKRSFLRDIKMRFYLFLAYFAFQPHLYVLTNFLAKNGLINHFTILLSTKEASFPTDSIEELSSFEASVGLSQIKKLGDKTSHFKNIITIYEKNLKLNFYYSVKSPYYLNILVNDRERFIKYMLKFGFEFGTLYDYSIPQFDLYKNHTYVQRNNCAQRIASQIVNLPLNASEGDVERMCSLINNYFLKQIKEGRS